MQPPEPQERVHKLEDRPPQKGDEQHKALVRQQAQNGSDNLPELPPELLAMVLSCELVGDDLSTLPKRASELASTCRCWHDLLASSDFLWFRVTEGLRASGRLRGVVAGATADKLPWKEYLLQCQQLACSKEASEEIFLRAPLRAGHVDTIAAAQQRYPGSAGSAGGLSVFSWLNRVLGSRSSTTQQKRDPDTRFVSMKGIAVKKLLYSLVLTYQGTGAFVRDHTYPGGAIALRMGEKGTLFLSVPLALNDPRVDGVVLVASSKVREQELSELRRHLAACSAHNRAMPVAVLVRENKDPSKSMSASCLAERLSGALSGLDNACVCSYRKVHDNEPMTDVALALTWMVRHFPRIEDSTAKARP